MIKQVIVVRKDLNMRKGKMIAQGAHASLKAASIAKREGYNQQNLIEWGITGYTKIVLGIEGETALQDLHKIAYKAGLPTSIIIDAGRTEFDGVPTFTAVAIGPAEAEEIDKITGALVLL